LKEETRTEKVYLQKVNPEYQTNAMARKENQTTPTNNSERRASFLHGDPILYFTPSLFTDSIAPSPCDKRTELLGKPPLLPLSHNFDPHKKKKEFGPH